ncbi:hypothetical protein ACETK3_02225 [Arthrobacter sp. E44]|uniref:hypothetical protein n=1 Tax=Arthrobacter sp. E44 TaxID=3341794 RepID=UPI0035A5F4E8
MSEVFNDEVDGKEENGFSRRRVVAGVAWSVPVIATAIAAPAAAASPGQTVPASFSWAPSSQASATGTLGTRTVQGPMKFTIQTGSAFTGTQVSYIITIQGNQTNQNAKLGISTSVPQGSATPVQPSDKATTFSGQLNAIPGNNTLTVELTGFTYTSPNKTGAFSYTASVTLNGVAQPQTSTLSITF